MEIPDFNNIKPARSQKNPFGVDSRGQKSNLKQKTAIPACFRKFKAEHDRIVNYQHGKISPIHAKIIAEFIPEIGEVSSFLMNGNCHFADFIIEFCKCLPPIEGAAFTTLAINDYTFEILDQIPCEKLLLVSSYFLWTDKANIIPQYRAQGRLKDYRVGFFRNHTKICLLKQGENHFVWEGSANLRSSGTVEQFTIANCKSKYDFHLEWITEFIEKYAIDRLLQSQDYNTGRAEFQQFSKLNGQKEK